LFLAASCGAIAALNLLLPSTQGQTRLQTLRAMLAPRHIALICLVGFVVVWAGFRFSLGSLTTVADRPHDVIDEALKGAPALRDIAYAVAEMPIPMPELVRGFSAAGQHLQSGHMAFFLGEVRTKGSPLFFPIGILVKSPIPFLILALVGIMYAAQRAIAARDWRPLAPALAAGAVLVAVIPVSINIGVRHILPIFPLLAILAAMGCRALWQWRGPARLGPIFSVVLLGWHLVSSVSAHPDYLAYFNECCQAHPERVLVDSDLDWGQDLKRLAAELKRRGVEEVNLAYFGRADPSRHGMPRLKPLQPEEHVTGWVAISEFRIAFGTGAPPYDQYRWLTAYTPVTRVGKSIRLYYLD
jgi:hypothetical protein